MDPTAALDLSDRGSGSIQDRGDDVAVIGAAGALVLAAEFALAFEPAVEGAHGDGRDRWAADHAEVSRCVLWRSQRTGS
jgi:hypothetical protein